MSLPGALCYLHICKHSLEAGIFRTARINSEGNRSGSFPHMADSHLRKFFSIVGTLNTVIIFSPAKSIPHLLYISWNSRSCPIGITMVCNNRAKMLKLFIFILNRSLEQFSESRYMTIPHWSKRWWLSVKSVFTIYEKNLSSVSICKTGALSFLKW